MDSAQRNLVLLFVHPWLAATLKNRVDAFQDFQTRPSEQAAANAITCMGQD